MLIQADLGLDTAARDRRARCAPAASTRRSRVDEVKAILAAEIDKVLAPVAKPLAIDPAQKPHVILVVGVNGTGKTTTIGKLAAKLRGEGRGVMLAAGDTFRAAAIEQLKIWGERTGARVVAARARRRCRGPRLRRAHARRRSRGADVLLIDTAGRLQNKDELMAELEKIVRVHPASSIPTAPHTVLLTLDATTGQNALQQVEIFGKRAGVTGLVMTKLDGTARGGILVAIAAKYGLPVHFIGVGEGSRRPRSRFARRGGFRPGASARRWPASETGIERMSPIVEAPPAERSQPSHAEPNAPNARRTRRQPAPEVARARAARRLLLRQCPRRVACGDGSRRSPRSAGRSSSPPRSSSSRR